MLARFAFAILIAGSAGCSRRGFSSREEAVSDRDTCVVALGVNPTTLDPGVSQDVITNDLLSHVYEGLVAYGPGSTLEPRIARSWELSPDGRTYTFHLDRTATFHDGRPIEAADVKWTWERNCDPKIESVTGRLYLGDIEGADARASGTTDHISGIVVVDAETLRVVLRKPRATFLGKLTYPVAFVMPRNVLPAGVNVRGAKDMIGSGPFKVESYVPDSEIVLSSFPAYRGGEPSLKRIRMPIVEDAATRISMLRQGKLDWAGVPHADLSALRDDPGFTILQADRPATFYLGMNGKVYPPFADVRVRTAFNCAIDRARIVRDVLGGVGSPAQGILPPGVPQLHRTKPTIPFDPRRGRSLLAESGWSGKMPALELWVSDPTGDRKRAAELAASMLKENLGVDVRLKLVESGVLIQKATKRQVGFFMGSWYMDYLDPENLLSVLLSAYGQNRTAYDRPEFTELCREADSLPDGDERLRRYAEAEDMALRDAVWVPLYHPQEAIAVKRSIIGLESNAFGVLPPTHVRRAP